jgi:tetratricopeptide (TPR) repeat protein
MKKPLTIHLLLKNNSDTIETCLNSLIEIDCEVLLCDLGCTDDTIEKALKYRTQITKLSFQDDFSKIRNQLIADSNSYWNMYLHPWESIIQGVDVIKDIILGNASAYKFTLLQGDIAIKQTRLWHHSLNLKFKNPVFETIEYDSIDLPVFLHVKNQASRFDLKKLAQKWRDSTPLSAEPTYYISCCELLNKNWDSFINYADLFLHQQKNKDMSFYMTNYYLAMVLCYIKKDYQKALNLVGNCVLKAPTMAEFWCLLADIFYETKDLEKAYSFYENAIILGSRRKNNCDWPMEISKYQEYPKKMMQACKSLKQNTNVYVGSKNQV